jgi:hypothetical protein
MLNALGIILHENAKPSTLQEDHPMWQQEFTWFFALFHQESCSAINLLYASLTIPLVYCHITSRSCWVPGSYVGFVAHFAQEVVQGPWPLAVAG